MSVSANNHYPVIIIGGGQSGLCISHYLLQKNIQHLVIEKGSTLNAWRDHRWDSFTLVTPNWQCQLPGHPYTGDDPDGFMNKAEIFDYLKGFMQKNDFPVLEDTSVTMTATLADGGFEIQTSRGRFTADQVVVATGAYHEPIVPKLSAAIPETIQQLHSEQYKNPESVALGSTLIVGSGQSGAQIAEDLHLAGRKVYLATGNAPRCARFYRGRDVVAWLQDMAYYEMAVDEHPLKDGVRDNTNHYVTGRDGGHDIDLRQFALEGMELFGHLNDFDGRDFIFADNLTGNLDAADKVFNNINERIDQYIEKNLIDAPAASIYQPCWTPEHDPTHCNLQSAGITSIIWCIGFKPDYRWLDVPAFTGKGYPSHQRGVSSFEGLYFIGLPWLHTWGSGRFSGVARDAEFVVNTIQSNLQQYNNNLKTA